MKGRFGVAACCASIHASDRSVIASVACPSLRPVPPGVSNDGLNVCPFLSAQ